jgi:hypothetical protein
MIDNLLLKFAINRITFTNKRIAPGITGGVVIFDEVYIISVELRGCFKAKNTAWVEEHVRVINFCFEAGVVRRTERDKISVC